MNERHFEISLEEYERFREVERQRDIAVKALESIIEHAQTMSPSFSKLSTAVVISSKALEKIKGEI